MLKCWEKPRLPRDIPETMYRRSHQAETKKTQEVQLIWGIEKEILIGG
jgi:hypothetical protein